LDCVKNVRLNDQDYYQELKMVDIIQEIFYIASSIIHFSMWYNISSNLEYSWISISKTMHLSEISQKTFIL